MSQDRRNIFDERQLKLDCIRIASQVAIAFKDQKVSVVETARAFYNFVCEKPKDE